jgi:hypothetical protein
LSRVMSRDLVGSNENQSYLFCRVSRDQIRANPRYLCVACSAVLCDIAGSNENQS